MFHAFVFGIFISDMWLGIQNLMLTGYLYSFPAVWIRIRATY